MRIGIVLSSAPGYSETFFKTKINGLTTAGNEVILFARGETNRDLNCNHVRPYPVVQHPLWRVLYAVVILPVVFLRAPRSVVRFWKLEKEDGQSAIERFRTLYLNAHILTKQVDWLHFGFATTALGRENAAKAIMARMAVSFRGYDINLFPLKNPGCYTKLWKRVDQVHSISRYLLQQAYELGLPPHKPSFIITPALATPLNPKTNFEFHDPVRILTVARLTSIKGLEYGIEAMAKLKAGGLNVQYTLVGDGAEYEKLLNQVELLGLKDDVLFAGKLSHKETLMQMGDCDVYIQPSLNEGFCNAVLEAQAIGCLCVASDVGALPENILNNETGWLVKPRDSNELAAVLIRILNLPIDERIHISVNARKRANSTFNLLSHFGSWQKFYSTSE